MMKIFGSTSMFKKIACGLGAVLALVAAYLFVPPAHDAFAQYSDQGTWGGTSTGTVTGSTTAYAITIPNLSANKPGVVLRFIPNITSVGPTQINVSGIGLTNVLRPSSIGNVAFSGGEFQAGELTCIYYNPTASAYQLGCNVDLTPIGRTVEFRGSTAPRGTLIEDGSCVSTTTYAALNSVIGTTYGSCSTGLFKLPFSNGTAFVAFDNQGANGAANRITTASCATPNSPVECGSQLATLTANLVPTIASGNASQSITVTAPGSGLVYQGNGVFNAAVNVALGTSGSYVAGTTSGGWAQQASISGSNNISVVSSGTGGTSPTHPVQNPMLPGIRGIKY